MKKTLCILLTLFIPLSLFGCSANAQKRYTDTVTQAFDTITTVVAYDTGEAEFKNSFKIVTGELYHYDCLFDIYDNDSTEPNLFTLNSKAKDAPVKVDRDIIELLKYGKNAYKESGGRINICFGAVLSLWHKAREDSLEDPENAYLPDEKVLKEASRHCNPDDLIINEENSTVFFNDSKMKLDVGAIAKGWCAQKLADSIAEMGLWKNFMLNLGGNVVTRGFKNGDGTSKWNVQIENPDLTSESALETLTLTDMSVVTSGDYQRYYSFNGKKYCHIIDTKTLMPTEYFSGVTVICKDSALADRLSTQLFLTPLSEGKSTVEALDGVEALWVDKDGKITYSSGFEKYKMP